MKQLKEFLSALVALSAWVIVGLIAASYMSAKLSVGIGFVAFVVVSVLTYPKNP